MKKQKTSKKSSKNKPKTKKTVIKKKESKVSDLVKNHGDKLGITPLGNRVLIKPFTKEEIEVKSNFGLIMPSSGSKDKSEQGIVLAVGRGEYKDGRLQPLLVRVGDKVAFSKYGYEDIKVDGEEYFLIKEENILAILK